MTYGASGTLRNPGATSLQSPSMIRWFKDLLYGSVPATFESAYSLEESVQRLSGATRRSMFSALTTEAAVGRVSAHRVSLQRVTPFFRNSFKPYFIGRFEDQRGKIVLTGQFTAPWFTKAFMTFWLGFCAVWTAAVTIAVLVSPETPKIMPFGGALMFALGCAFVSFAKKLSAKDVPWLSQLIQTALSKSPNR